MQLAHAAPRRALRRLAAIAVVIVASVLVSSTLLIGTASAAMLPTHPAVAADITDATDGSSSACTGRPAFKAVIVLGPLGGSSSRYLGWANKIAAAAADAGMAVCKVYSPYADATTVRTAARGADVFVVLGHGNGYPHETAAGHAAKGTWSDDTAHGLGLNADPGSSSLRYYGANWVMRNLHLAPNAIVILSHMCNTSGNSEDADRIPDYALAIDHVDNFAQGFLHTTSSPSGGSPSVVMALQSQSFDPHGNTLFSSLMTSDATMDQAFMKTYGANTGSWAGSYLPNYGAVGSSDLYVTKRSDGSDLISPGGRLHLDPDLAYAGHPAPEGWDPNAPDISWLDRFAGKAKNIQNPAGAGLVRFGYVRSIAGDLDLRLPTWREGAASAKPTPTPDLVEVPDVSGATVSDATAMLEAADFRVGAQKQVYSDSVADGRVVDTDPSRLRDGSPAKYQRGKTLDLQVSKGPPPPAKLTRLTADQGSGTIPADGDALPVFTPNGDGTSDTLTLRYTSSVAAPIRVTVTNSAGKVVRIFRFAGKVGSSTFHWNGKSDKGSTVADGTYVIAAHVKGGNTRTTSVKSLTAIKVPTTSNALINARDGDNLADSATQSVAVRMTATLSWRILDARGDVVRTGMDAARVTKGTTTWAWDGKDDAGAFVPDGTYTSMVTATTSRGSYSHQVRVRVMAYRVLGDFRQRPGQSTTFDIHAAEQQQTAPTISVKQKGRSAYTLTFKKVGTDHWSAVWKARSGPRGTVTFTISGTDAGGGTDAKTWKGAIR
jgi:flagellar hook assembly protein FlgD